MRRLNDLQAEGIGAPVCENVADAELAPPEGVPKTTTARKKNPDVSD